jgi:peroxin-19
MKGILNQVVKDIISKESLYTPMKVLKDEFPAWLENNWQNLSDDDLEKYNK